MKSIGCKARKNKPKFVNHKCRSAFSLVEVLVVLIIVVIVTLGFGASANRQIKRTNRETVVNEMQVLASNLADAYYDLGNPAYDPTTTEGSTQFTTFLQTVSSEYLGYTFDYTTLTSTANGFTVEVSDPTDVYEQHYKCWFVTKDGQPRYVMIACGGDDGIISASGYAAHNYADDIILIVRPKLVD